MKKLSKKEEEEFRLIVNGMAYYNQRAKYGDKWGEFVNRKAREYRRSKK